MTQAILSASIAIVATEIVAFAQATGQDNFGGIFGLVTLIGTAICFTAGVVLCIIRPSREIGKGLLIASAALFVIALLVWTKGRLNLRST